MQTSTKALILEIRKSLAALDTQEENLKQMIRNQTPVHVDPATINYFEWRDRQGRPMLLDVTIARANLLAAMANLQATLTKR